MLLYKPPRFKFILGALLSIYPHNNEHPPLATRFHTLQQAELTPGGKSPSLTHTL